MSFTFPVTYVSCHLLYVSCHLHFLSFTLFTCPSFMFPIIYVSCQLHFLLFTLFTFPMLNLWALCSKFHLGRTKFFSRIISARLLQQAITFHLLLKHIGSHPFCLICQDSACLLFLWWFLLLLLLVLPFFFNMQYTMTAITSFFVISSMSCYLLHLSLDSSSDEQGERSWDSSSDK